MIAQIPLEGDKFLPPEVGSRIENLVLAQLKGLEKAGVQGRPVPAIFDAYIERLQRNTRATLTLAFSNNMFLTRTPRRSEDKQKDDKLAYYTLGYYPNGEGPFKGVYPSMSITVDQDGCFIV